MSLLEVRDIGHGFGEKLLFKESSFDLYKGEHMGLVGENGAGKSTLMKILLGEELADEGSLKWQKGIKIGYIDQYLKAAGNISVDEYLKIAFKEDFAQEEKLNSFYEELGLNYSEELMDKIGKLQEDLENRGFYKIETSIDKVVLGLGIDSFGRDTKLENLSGGQQSKVILARLLLENSDVLLLDEPTNFLDQNHVLWLIDYLNNFKGAFIVISHNISFLNAITTCICDIEFNQIKKYHGNYNKFIKLKEEYRLNHIKNYSSQQEYIKKTEEYIRRNKAGVNSRMARGRQKQLDRVERLDPPSQRKKPSLEFQLSANNNARLELKKLEVGYDYALLPALSMIVDAGEKIVISGFNGIGKSTLLKTIVGEINKISGGIDKSYDMRIGYYQQDIEWEDDNLNALEAVKNHYPRLKTEEIRKHLNRCGVESKDLNQPLNSLSGGEQSKVKLCLILLKSYNLIILDEPTNHLDQQTKDSLKEALINYEGSVILVSHEKDFYEEWIDRVYDI